MGKGGGMMGGGSQMQGGLPGKGGAAPQQSPQQTPGPQMRPDAAAPAGSVQAGGPSSPYAQGQAMYAQPYMYAGMGGQSGQQGSPYSFQPMNVGVNGQALMQGMQNYYTPIPQQMPQSPYLAGYTYGGNAPTGKPGDPMPLAPVQANQIPYAAGLASLLPAGTPGATSTPAASGGRKVR